MTLRVTNGQFVLTLDIEADNVLAVQVSESSTMIRYVLNCRAHTVFLQTGNLVNTALQFIPVQQLVWIQGMATIRSKIGDLLASCAK